MLFHNIENIDYYTESNYSVDSDYHSIGNQIGNCSLLEKTFNISKGSDTLDTWLSKIENFPSCDWKKALSIPIEMSSPDFQMKGSGKALSQIIGHRTENIKGTLIRYISESGKQQ